MIRKILILFILVFSVSFSEIFVQDYIDLGDEYYKSEDYENALISYTEGLKIEPGNVILLEKVADIYLERREYEIVIDMLEKNKSVTAVSDIMNKQLGLAYKQKFDFEIKMLKEELELNPKNKWQIDQNIYKAEHTLREKFFDYYKTYLTMIEYSDPEEVFFLGNNYFMYNLYERAYDTFKLDKTESMKNMYGAGVTARFLGYYRSAITYYKKALEKNDKFEEIYLGLGVSHQMLKEFDKAIVYFEEYLKIKEDAAIYADIAVLQIEKEDYLAARKIVEKGLRKFPDSQELRELMQEIYIK